MNITMIGTGYVGLVTGTCFAESGNDVVCLDIDESKIAALNNGDVPIYEPGLSELVRRNVAAGRLKFTTDYSAAVPRARCVFIAVGTPQADNGAADLSAVWRVADTLASHLSDDAVVVLKSTVPVGTNRKLALRLRESAGREIDVVSNPEFLKEGAAIGDFTKPDRVVVGTERPQAVEVLRELYQPFLRTDRPFLVMGLESAEMTKYVANSMLATKISFINEMANLCEQVGADIEDVRRGIAHDQRIGFSFLFPGVGYGGSCFPKDIRAMIHVAEDAGFTIRILQAVDEVNSDQKEVLFQKITRYFSDNLADRTIAVWGLSFKPGTDDIREAPSLVLLDRLLEAGCRIRVHDPVAQDNVRARYGDRLAYFDHHYDAVEGADALAIVTEWSEFRNPDFSYLKHKMKSPVIFDGRNLYDPKKVQQAGITYHCIGRTAAVPR